MARTGRTPDGAAAAGSGDRPPAVWRMLVRAALRRRAGGSAVPKLPELRPVASSLRTDPERLAAYDRLCGFPLSDLLPSTYPYVLSFPLQMQLLSDRSFPLRLAGLVHVRNEITVRRPIPASEELDIAVWAERFEPSRRGATVDVCIVVRSAGTEVWRGRSTYLSRNATAPPDAGAPREPLTVDVPARAAARWRIPADSGRRYARVSGDVNPLHLSALTARPFGFPRAIAHGMWLTAKVLASLNDTLPDRFTVDVAFRQPVLLPSTVQLATADTGDGWNFAVRSTAGTDHLIGTVRSL